MVFSVFSLLDFAKAPLRSAPLLIHLARAKATFNLGNPVKQRNRDGQLRLNLHLESTLLMGSKVDQHLFMFSTCFFFEQSPG